MHRSILSHGTAATAIQECCRLKPYARLSRRRLLIDKCAIVTGALQLQLAHPLLILLYFYFSAPLPHLNVVVGRRYKTFSRHQQDTFGRGIPLLCLQCSCFSLRKNMAYFVLQVGSTSTISPNPLCQAKTTHCRQ